MRKFIEPERVKNYRRSGRLRATLAHENNTLLKIWKSMSWKTVNDMNIEWKKSSRAKVTSRKLRSKLNEAAYIIIAQPRQNPSMQYGTQIRLQWDKEHRD